MFCQDFTQKENKFINFNTNFQNKSIHSSNAPISHSTTNNNKSMLSYLNPIPKKNTIINPITETITINDNESAPKGQKGKVIFFIITLNIF